MFFWLSVATALIVLISSLIGMFKHSMSFDAIAYGFWAALSFVFLIGLTLGRFLWA